MNTSRICMAVAMTLGMGCTVAQTKLDELRGQIAKAMPPAIGQNNTELAKKMLSIQPGPPLSRTFQPAKAARLLMGRAPLLRARDCKPANTAVGEADESLCQMTMGKLDDPTGAFTVLSYSRNMGWGQIRYVRREAFRPDDALDLPEVKKTDEQAYAEALKYLQALGLSLSDIPKPPPGVKNPYPVRSLAMGVADERGSRQATRVVVQKVVEIPRAFEVPGGLYTDRVTGIALQYVTAPGVARVFLNDRGVQALQVDDWSDVRLDKTLDARRAKTDKELVDEIAEDLYSEGVREAHSVSIILGLKAGMPNPEDPDSPNCPACLLKPSLKVMVTSVDRDSFKPTAAQPFAPAGVVKEYDLIHPADTLPSR